MIAVVPVREGALPAGGEEVVAEAGGRALLVGEGAVEAAHRMAVETSEILAWETSGFRPAAWAAALAARLGEETAIILPASPDGRDLAPRLAHVLGRPLFAGAVRVEPHSVILAEHDRQVAREIAVEGPFVATLLPGVRGLDFAQGRSARPEVEILALELAASHEAELIELLPADPATIDLAEAGRIVSGGLGLGGAAVFRQMQYVATALGASFSGTRAAADQGWLPQERFVGTTGAQINPNLYIALGISGAIQHVSGLGRPNHIVAVNLDAGCPMMALANVSIVSDARAVIQELADRLGIEVAENG